MPLCSRFAPENTESAVGEPVVMTVEEYETIRLIDYRGFNQHQCSEFMGIARTTVQNIYDSARGKIAAALVEGRRLVIQGGSFRLCDGKERACQCGGCKKHCISE